MQGLGIIAAAIFFCLRKRKQNEKKLEEMSVDWDQVENFYTEEPAGSSTNFQADQKFVSLSTLNVPHVSPPISTRNSNPNEYIGDNSTKDGSTVVNDEFHEERLTLMKPSAIDKNEERFVCDPGSQSPTTVKPDHGSQ